MYLLEEAREGKVRPAGSFSSWSGGNRLDLHTQHVDIGGACVLERMRREGRAPQGS
jgi:hypothetical protein